MHPTGFLPIIDAMQSLRHIKLYARFVLVWFAMSIGVAIASPVVKPKAMELICSGMGLMKVLAQTDGGGTQELASHTLDCPLCASNNAPPPPLVRLVAESTQALSHVLQGIAAAHIASLSAAPPPARGPPAFS
jgi:hypothetical protein